MSASICNYVMYVNVFVYFTRTCVVSNYYVNSVNFGLMKYIFTETYMCSLTQLIVSLISDVIAEVGAVSPSK